jgi:hypothetical protein
MFETFLCPKLDDVDTEHVWFQQDRATAHTAQHSLRVLREMFPGRLISLRGNVKWPARSPDLSPCDFFLWGYLKEKVFKHRPRSLEDLKERIRQEINAIPPEITQRVMKNFRERLQKCFANDGRHMSDMIFKTHYIKLFIMYFSEIYSVFFLDRLFHFLCLFKMWEIFMSRVDKLIANGKKIVVKAPLRLQKLKEEATSLPLPHKPILTR